MKIFIKKKDYLRIIFCLFVECFGIKLMVGVVNIGYLFYIYIYIVYCDK